MKRVNVSAVRVIPEVIFDQDLHADLSLRHNRIIKEWPQCSAKQIVSFSETRLTSSAAVQHQLRGSPRRDTFDTR